MAEQTSQIENTPNPSADIPNSQILDVAEEFPKDAREWFSKISVEECVSALGFEDKVALSVLVMLAASPFASPLSARSQPTVETADRPRGQYLSYGASTYARRTHLE
jgi:hypothetical protein